MSMYCWVQRVGETIHGAIQADGRELFTSIVIASDNSLMTENHNESWVELDILSDIDDVEWIEFVFPVGLPTGYTILAFFRKSKGVLSVLGCVLYGPGNFIDCFASIEEAVNEARDRYDAYRDAGPKSLGMP